ncbi:MAG: hypothetical protein LBP92_12760 [Deltaproteobacteria bacterium]|jgi:hypothetical protein|nr:hypothetical protein [Deltaproteobacteria bacterium]
MASGSKIPQRTAGASIRCPRCGRIVRLPALDCPHCLVDLKEATAPKKPKFRFFRWLFSWLAILACLAVAGWLISRVVTGGPVIPGFLRERLPSFLSGLAGRGAAFF